VGTVTTKLFTANKTILVRKLRSTLTFDEKDILGFLGSYFRSWFGYLDIIINYFTIYCQCDITTNYFVLYKL